MTPDRRHSRAKKNTVETPVSTKAHHCQLPATPYCRTCWVTQFGVSLLNVVATIDSPASHHGTERPEAKNSDVFFPARRAKNNAGTKQISTVSTTMTQSMVWSVMGSLEYKHRSPSIARSAGGLYRDRPASRRAPSRAS